MFDLTGGAFDISIGTGLPSLELDADDFLVRATTDGVQVDLGGIGKGYAVDLMAELLEEWGLQRALVHGGFSSVLALEPPAGRDGWPLTLSDPAAPRACWPASRCARRRWGPPACARATTSWIRAPASPSAGGSPPGSRCRGPPTHVAEPSSGPRLAPAAPWPTR